MGLVGSSNKRSRRAAAVITGAGSGIGAAFATELARRGGRVVCSDIDENAARATAGAIGNEGGDALAVRCDVAQIDDVHRLAVDAQDWFGGPPTLVINNAGVGAGGMPIGDVSLDDWQWALGINLWGPIHRCHVFAPILREASSSGQLGGIINVASAAAFGAAPGMAAYNVSKAGVLSLSETLAAELSGTGVNVTVLCPTFVKTNIVEAGRITDKVWDTPLTGLVARLGKAHLHRQVSDPWLRRQLTPDFTPGCKRMLISSDYYPALQRDNCKLIDWPIATISPVGIRTSDGVEHHLDCIVFATGYDVHLTGPPYPVTGIGGRSLADEWATGAQAYKSINAHGYPNLFFMTGPNSGPGHNSLLVYVEGQLDYAVRGITTVLGENLRYLDVRADVQRRYNERIQKRLTKTTWMSGCSSWYLTEDGFNASMYPGFATQYLRQMRDFRFGDYDAVARDAHTVTGARSQA